MFKKIVQKKTEEDDIPISPNNVFRREHISLAKCNLQKITYPFNQKFSLEDKILIYPPPKKKLSSEDKISIIKCSHQKKT